MNPEEEGASSKPKKFQKENVYNKFLPYGDELEEESDKLFMHIKTNLVKSVLAREMRPGCALWTSTLNKYIKIYGMKFTKEDHLTLIKLYYELLIIPDLEPIRIIKCATTLTQLLKKKYLLTRDELQLDWRPLYDLKVRALEKSKVYIGMYRYPSNFEGTLQNLLRAARVYFPASATKEILDEFRPQLCPFNTADITDTIKYLELFLPCAVKPEEADISYKLWFDELMTLWDVCHDACAWENSMMWLMANLTRFQLGHINWQPYIPIMFVRFQRSLSLPVTFKQKQIGKIHKIDVSTIAIWIVCILSSEENNIAFFHFEKFMQSLESYFHPANFGRWIPKLREFLRQISYYFVQRIHCERYRTPSWDFKVPEHYKLKNEEIDRFVNIMKPCMELAMYSRFSSQDITLAFQYLASLRPNIIIPMTLEKLYSSMSSLTEPHKLTSSMTAVIATGRYMVQGARNGYPEGPTNVIPLLIELLPGIDPNDLRKSYVTFNFIVHFVNMIPLINSSDASNYYELTEEEHAICEATATFEDFVLQFFDRICMWMESNSLDFVRQEQSVNNDNVRNRTETISETVLGSLIGVVLMQCSPEIFKSALRKFFSFVTSKIMEVHISGKLSAIGCHYFTKVNPKETLKLFLPYLCDTIESLLMENPNIDKEEHIDDTLMYNLLILSEVVDGRSELIQYIDRLTNILDKTLHMTCSAASQLTARMLELIMMSLTNIVPTEMRSSPKDYSLPIKDFLSIREWGAAQDIKNLKLSWYVPGKEEVKIVQNLLKRYLIPELEKLEQYSENKCTLTRTEIRRTLKIIISILSCQPLLPMWDEPPIQLVESVLDPWAFNLKVSNSDVVTMPDGGNVRKSIADVLHKLQQKLLQDNEGDIKSFRNILNIYNIILFNKTRGLDFEFHWKSFHMTKRLLEDRLHQKKLHLRSVLIDRVMLQQEFRIETRNCSFTQTHRQILLDLFTLSVSRYSEVRKCAQSKLFAVISYFAYSYTVLTDILKETLTLDSQEHHETFKGCLYVLLGPKSGPIIARHDWQFVREIWPLIVKSMPSEKPSIINLVTAITDAVEKYFPTIAIKLVIPDSALTAAYALAKTEPLCDLSNFQKAIAQSESYLKRKSDERRITYEGTVCALLDALENGNLHWRYNLMALNFLKNLVHFDVKYNPQVVKYFLNALINESITVRKVAIKVMVFIFIQNKPNFKKVPFDIKQYAQVELDKVTPGIREDNKWLLYNSKTLPKTAEQWNEKRFVHDRYTGYYAWPKKLEVYDSPSNQVTPAKYMKNLNEIERNIYEFFSDKTKIGTLIKYLSMEEKKGQDQFNSYRFYMFKNLFKLFEDKFLPVFIPHLRTLVQDKIESHQRCSAEIISALIRGSKHWEYDQTKQLWDELCPILEDAIVNMCSETQLDWAVCLTMGLESRDPNKSYFLLEYLLKDPLKDPTSFIACIRLHLLSTVISQQNWRNMELFERLLDYVRPHLSHHFQNIREKISALLVTILCEDTILPLSNTFGSKKTLYFFKEVFPKLEGLYKDYLDRKDNGALMDCDNGDEFSEKETNLRLFKTVIRFITLNMIRVNYSARPEYFELLPLAAVLQNNEKDEELANCSTNFLVVLSQTMTLSKYIPYAIEAFKKVSSCPYWSARAVLAEFLPVFVFYNMATIIADKSWVLEIQSIVLQLLEDNQPEVRVEAAKVLSGLLHCQFILDPQQLLLTFKQMAKKKLKSKSEIGNNNLHSKHAGVLGLCAFIEAYPYDVPNFLPAIFEQLRPRLSDPQPIPATIRKTLGDFKRTHHNNWEQHKLKFTEEELSVLSDLTVPPSYYV